MTTTATPLNERKFLTNDEAADLLGISRRTMPVWRVQGKGPKFFKVGKLVRYDKEVVAAWIESNTHSNTSHSGAMSY